MARGQGLALDPAALRSARQRAGLSQRQVAEVLRTTRQQIIRYEQGAEKPEVKRLSALARAIGAGVGDIVANGALPGGLAGLRIEAGLTLAAAAGAVRSHLPQGAGIACSRPVLAEAERGTLPPTWTPAAASGAVRTAFGTVYETRPEEVAAAWTATFGPASVEALPEPENTNSRNHTPTTRDTEQAGSINGTPDEEVSETTPPFPAPGWLQELPVCPYSPAELAAAQLKSIAEGVYEVRVDHTAQGRVRRDGPGRWSFAPLDPKTGQPRSYIPVIAKRPTRALAVEALLSTPGLLWSAPMPGSIDPLQDTDQTPEAPGVSVLVSGGPESAQVYMDGDYVGHLENRHSWDQQDGWTYRVRLTDTDRARMGPGQQDAPDAVTNLSDIATALPVLLEEAYGRPVPVTSLSGERTDLPIRGRDMERWELRRGRVSGREDIYVRSRCWGWIQRDGKGFTAHTVEGIVSEVPAPTREGAAAALWAHLTAPLPPPLLGERARTKRRLRSHATLARPVCPYSPAELARVSVVEAPASETGARLYQAQAPDGAVLGFLWRSGRGWSRCTATPQGAMPAPPPPGASFPTRKEALETLLSQPGPLWADPAEVIVH